MCSYFVKILDKKLEICMKFIDYHTENISIQNSLRACIKTATGQNYFDIQLFKKKKKKGSANEELNN